MNKYIVVLKNSSDIESFKKSMNSISALNSTPERSVEAKNIKGTRCFECNLTEEEANKLLNCSFVKQIEQDNRNKIKKIIFNENNYNIKIKKSAECKKKDFLINRKIKSEINRSPTIDSNEEISILARDQLASIQGLPKGSGVDVVIVDGKINPNNQEMLNSAGQSRVQSINWFYFANEPGDSRETFNKDSEEDNHGQHVAGTACGLTQGWASEANIYNADFLNKYEDTISGIINWHGLKTNGNPTITNHSYGYSLEAVKDIRYISSVTINGSKITPPRNYSGAFATANRLNGEIQSITVTSGGSNYKNAPDVSFSGGGKEMATAILGSGSIYIINVTNVGSGYISPPTINFSSAPPGGTTATGRCVLEDGKLKRIIITNRGRGYTTPPTITFSPPPTGGVLPTAAATLKTGEFISKITITNGGNSHQEGYIPWLILRGGGCTKEALYGIDSIEMQNTMSTGTMSANLFVIEDKVEQLSSTSFRQTATGGQYTSAPSISFFYQIGYGPRAVATVSSSGAVVGVRVLEGGSGYTSNPTIVFTNGGGFTRDQIYSWGVSYVSHPPEYNGLGQEVPLNSNEGVYYIDYLPARESITDSLMEDMIQAGIVVVAAAGNNGSKICKLGEPGYNDNIEIVDYVNFKENPDIPDDGPPEISSVKYIHNFARGTSPGSSNGVISVGSMNYNCCPETRSFFSNTGTRVDLYAPGEKIISSVHSSTAFGVTTVGHPNNPANYLAKISGTSMASPQVAGALASYATNNRTINQTSALNWLNINSKTALQEQTYYSLHGGTNKILHYPGLVVS